MKVVNYEELKKVCEERGWNTDAYLDEIEKHLFANGGYGNDINYYGAYCDCFKVVRPSIIEIQKDDKFIKIEETPENINIYDNEGWAYVQMVEEPLYIYYK